MKLDLDNDIITIKVGNKVEDESSDEEQILVDEKKNHVALFFPGY